MVIFPPVNVVQVLPGGVHAVLPLMSPLEVFCTIITAFVCMDLERGPHQCYGPYIPDSTSTQGGLGKINS